MQDRAGLGPLVRILLHGAWRHKWLLVVGIAIGAGGGVFRGLVTPNQYQSTGKLYIKPGVRDALAPDAVIAGAAGGRFNMGLREAVQNEMQVLTAPALFEKIVERVGVDELLAPYDPSELSGGTVPWHTALFHSFQSWWFAAASQTETDLPASPARLASMMLAGSISITPEPGTSVIEFAYTSHSPELARRVVDAALEAARDLHREVFATMTAVAAMEEEAKTEEAAAREAEQRLRDFRVEKGLYDFESRQKDLVDYLNTVDAQLDSIAVDMERLKAEKSAVNRSLDMEPRTRRRTGSDTAVLNPAYTALVEQQSFLLQKLLELAIEAAERPSGIVEQRRKSAQEQLESIQAQLDQVPVQIRIEGVDEENPDYVRLHQRMIDVSIQIEGLVAQQAQLKNVQSTSRKQLSELEALAPEIRALEEDARQKRIKADRIAEGVANVRTVQRLEQLNLSDVQVMHAATLAANKIAPQRSKMVLMGAFAGAAIALALASLSTLMDRRVRLPEDLVRLGSPADAVLRETRSEPKTAPWTLPAALTDARDDIAEFWASLPYDRSSDERFRIALLACGEGVDPSRSAAVLALGLAAHGGEDVVVVTTRRDGGWLANRLALPTEPGWTDVVRGARTLDQVEVTTSVPGLEFVPCGDRGDELREPLTTQSFADLLASLGRKHRFVVIDLPDVERRPEARAALALVDAVHLVVGMTVTEKPEVRQAMRAAETTGARLLGMIARTRRMALHES